MRGDRLFRTRWRCKLRLAAGLLLLAAVAANAAGAERPSDLAGKRVLLLYAYHPSFPSSEQILAGVRSVFDRHGLTLNIEYMDSKRGFDATSRANFLQVFSLKLANRAPYDLILLSDDNALEFAVTHREHLFADVPLVFLAVNDKARAIELDREPWVTGVVEAVSYTATVAMMHSLLPKLERITVVTDATPSGLADRAIAEQLARQFSAIEFQMLSLGEMSWVQLSRRLGHLRPNTAVLRMVAFRDQTGQVLDYTEAVRTITNSSTVPVFALRENEVRAGALGGVVVSHFEQGRQAALLAERVLGGEPISAIPVIRQSPNHPVFEYTALRRFDIRHTNLPPDSIVLNIPTSTIDRYGGLIATGLIIIVSLVGLISFLVWHIRTRQRIEENLKNSEERFRNLIEGSIEGILIDQWRKPLFVNQSFAAMLGYTSPDEILAMEKIDPCVAPHERERLQRYTEKRMRGRNAPTQYEYEAVRKDGSLVCLQNVVRTVDWNGQPAIQSTVIDVTQRNRAVEALQQYERIVSATSDFMSFIDSQYVYRAVNATYLEAFGKTKEQIVGHHVSELVSEAVFQTMYKPNLDRCLAGEHVNFQTWFDYPVYGRRFMHIYYDPYIDTSGSVIGVVVDGRDITEQRKVEDALRESEERLRDVTDAVSDWIWEMGPDLRFTYFSGRIEQATGIPAEFFVGKTRDELMNGNWDGVARQQHLADLKAQRAFRDFVYEMRLPQGTRYLKISGKPLFNQEGQFLGYRGTGSDITDQRWVEKALEASRKRYRALYDDNPSMYFTVLPDGAIVSVNLFGAKQLGYAVSQLIGTPLTQIVHEGDRGVIDQYIRTITSDPDGVHRCETRVHHNDGTLLRLRYTARSTQDVDDQQVVLVVCEDITESHKLSQELAYQASHDSLTGLVNRREFENRLTKLLDSANEGELEHALCYLDLDQFKVINDICGHVAGDELLRQLGKVLKEKIRKRDILARLGGDEFGVILEGCSLQQAESIAETLQNVIRAFRFVWEEKIFAIGVSIGLVPINRTGQSVTGLLSLADAACYAAKDAGRNRIHVYHETDSEFVKRHGEMQLVSMINVAFEEDLFYLVAQPIVPLDETRRIGQHYELLIRMRDKHGEVVPPDVFLSAAERYNLAVRVDRWVIETALAWLNEHPRHHHELFLCSINLSGHSLGDKEFLRFIIEQLDHRSIVAEKICFEITETAAIANLDSANHFIKILKQRGCRFALDDFGSGLSSFAYLKNLPVDFLKIDGMFVRDIVDDPIALAMVKSINEIGRVMGKQTIAEFVENPLILSELQRLGVDYAQGYGIGQPRPISELISPRTLHAVTPIR